MNNPEKLAAYGINDEEKQNNMCWTSSISQTKTNNVNKDMSPPTNNWRSRRTEHRFLCGNRNGHHNMELGSIEAVSFIGGGN